MTPGCSHMPQRAPAAHSLPSRTPVAPSGPAAFLPPPPPLPPTSPRMVMCSTASLSPRNTQAHQPQRRRQQQPYHRPAARGLRTQATPDCRRGPAPRSCSCARMGRRRRRRSAPARRSWTHACLACCLSSPMRAPCAAAPHCLSPCQLRPSCAAPLLRCPLSTRAVHCPPPLPHRPPPPLPSSPWGMRRLVPLTAQPRSPQALRALHSPKGHSRPSRRPPGHPPPRQCWWTRSPKTPPPSHRSRAAEASSWSSRRCSRSRSPTPPLLRCPTLPCPPMSLPWH